MAKHAYLSASASERWLKCPPSAKLCAQEEDRGSPFAQQGTDAHELCQYLVEKALGRDARDPTENLTWFNAEMQEAAEGYAAFVMEQIAEAKKLCEDPLVCVEQTVDFSKWVQHGFGTADCLIVADDLLHIIDMKFGVGVLVSASGEDGTGNSQLKCYALGALDTFGDGTYAALMHVLRETYKNAVPIIREGNQYKYTQKNANTRVDGFTKLLGAFAYNGRIIPVEFGIKRSSTDSTKLYIVTTIKEDPRQPSTTQKDAYEGSVGSSLGKTIEDIIKLVKPEDGIHTATVMKHQQPNGHPCQSLQNVSFFSL